MHYGFIERHVGGKRSGSKDMNLKNISQRPRLLALCLVDLFEFVVSFRVVNDFDPRHVCPFPSFGWWDPLQDVVDTGNIRDGFTRTAPAFDALFIDKDRSPNRNVLTIGPGCVQQAVVADDLRPRIAQDRKVMFCDFFPYLTSMLHVIHTQGDDLRLPFVEFLLVPRELARLSLAIRSQVPAIDDQTHPATP